MAVSYPMDLPDRVQVLERMLQLLMAAAQTRPALDQISGGKLQIGADGGPRIVLAIGEDGLPELRFYPDSGTSYARIVAGSDGGATGIGMIGEAGTAGNKFQVLHRADTYQVLHMGAVADQADGGMLQLGVDFAASGYFGTADQFQNYWYHQADRTSLVGRFANNSANSYWGMIVGGVTVGSGGSGGIVTYGPTMASTMRPVACVRDGAATPNFTWCVTASSTTGFTVSWSNSTGKEIDYCSFRT
ncbi:hypothetical protein DQ384_05505 [Sphaerisporangium album]|uniref:Uncharacterized protein n=1 Tax=Sphaerisporangium album TaxID=509200 RepID=A0A367FQ14_9ACTN|nr:hypothetical protein [Sphaerisporangium album]RCG31999.1 hypothetical protein DQ384_05505 [Sphaerisporangium album]